MRLTFPSQYLIVSIVKRYAVWVCLLFAIISHVFFLNRPPDGVHLWRQCNTLAVARNLAEEEMNPMHPRVDRRNDTNGITGSHFPLYEWVVACGYRLFGQSWLVHGLVSLAIHLLSIIAIYRLTFIWTNSRLNASGAAIALACSPELFYYAIAPLPDTLALLLSIVGLALIIDWNLNKKPTGWALLGGVCLVLSGLTKIQYLAVGFPIACAFLYDWRITIQPKRMLLVLLLAFVCSIFPLLWYRYAVEQIKLSGLNDFGIEFRPADSVLSGLTIFFNNLTSDLPETLVNYGGAVYLIISLFHFKKITDLLELKWAFIIWLAALAFYYVIELRQMSHHGYYLMPFLPPLFILVGKGIEATLKNQRYYRLGLVVLVAMPILACLRIIPPRWTNQPKSAPNELYAEVTRMTLEKATPDSALCIVGPDVSGCILFYFLNKKGFGFNNPDELLRMDNNGKTSIEKAISKGARYLYLYRSDAGFREKLAPYTMRNLKETEEFWVAELGPVQK